MNNTTKHRWMTLLVVAAALLAGPMAQADVVTDWNITATDIAVAAKLPPPPTLPGDGAWSSRPSTKPSTPLPSAIQRMRVKLDAAPGASVEAAVAAANRATLSQLVPSAAGRDRQRLPDRSVRHPRWPGEDRRDRGRGTGRRSHPRAARR